VVLNRATLVLRRPETSERFAATPDQVSLSGGGPLHVVPEVIPKLMGTNSNLGD
jgi:hypothetical protein